MDRSTTRKRSHMDSCNSSGSSEVSTSSSKHSKDLQDLAFALWSTDRMSQEAVTPLSRTSKRAAKKMKRVTEHLCEVFQSNTVLRESDQGEIFADKAVALQDETQNQQQTTPALTGGIDIHDSLRQHEADWKRTASDLSKQIASIRASLQLMKEEAEAAKKQVRVDFLALRKELSRLRAVNMRLRADNAELRAGIAKMQTHNGVQLKPVVVQELQARDKENNITASSSEESDSEVDIFEEEIRIASYREKTREPSRRAVQAEEHDWDEDCADEYVDEQADDDEEN